MNVSALELLEGLPSGSTGAAVLHPPAMLGVLGSADETSLDEKIAAFIPVAQACHKALRPGGITLFLGESQSVSAWEVAASWGDLHSLMDLVVLWLGDTYIGYTPVLCSVRPGYRYSPAYTTDLGSNVIACHPVPDDELYGPAQLPVELFNLFLSTMTLRDDLVVDPYCGWGSSLVAAAMCSREWVGADIDAERCRIARRRTTQLDIEAGDLRDIYTWNDQELTAIGGD